MDKKAQKMSDAHSEAYTQSQLACTRDMLTHNKKRQELHDRGQ